ncbi:hypothetical protein C482_15096 [Natrialba chahannaoensis JCM 10990]|uniref:Uncharacterized protein n=1 Tax=Natrialba chahannaoensis JCM 10990 TaxID=1227492 RepID=M0AFQ8_9EURY|nr:hypothetical protein [Natrialba chahannaoensis]ELY96712.1 hypothetical protein C482_15096 [Natrialba chahannaoensis JCM 10990]
MIGLLSGGIRFTKWRIKERNEYIVLQSKSNQVKNRISGYEALTDPLAIIWIEPDQIQYFADVFDKYGHEGAIYDGLWDRQRKKITESTKYIGLKERFLDGKTWEETKIFEDFLEIIQNGGQKDQCYTREDLLERYREIDDLYDSIKSHGILTQSEIRGDEYKFENILLNIGRDGELLFNGNGWHRLCISKILGLSKIPVRIYVRHREWQEKRESIAKKDIVPTQYATHPDIECTLPK